MYTWQQVMCDCIFHIYLRVLEKSSNVFVFYKAYTPVPSYTPVTVVVINAPLGHQLHILGQRVKI